MNRRNNDSFYGPPSSSNQYGHERTEPRSAYNTRHPAAFNSHEHNSNVTERDALYDPYDVASSDSEAEGHEDRTVNQRSGHRGQYEGPARHNFGPRNSAYSMPSSRPDQSSHGHPAWPMATPGAARFLPNAFEEQGVNGVERSLLAAPDKELATSTLRITPPTLKVDYQHQSGFGGTGVDQIKATTEVSRKRSRSPSREIRGHFSCDLCEVELSEANAFEEHLECRSHWDTLEHIQLQNKYDDMTIAFIQDSLLQKLRKGNLAMDDDTMSELCKKDQMTRVEMLHCGPCKVYIPMSDSSIQQHLSSPRHTMAKKDFRVRQMDASPARAKDLMKTLEPQYIQFLQGKDPV